MPPRSFCWSLVWCPGSVRCPGSRCLPTPRTVAGPSPVVAPLGSRAHLPWDAVGSGVKALPTVQDADHAKGAMLVFRLLRRASTTSARPRLAPGPQQWLCHSLRGLCSGGLGLVILLKVGSTRGRRHSVYRACCCSWIEVCAEHTMM